MPSTTEWRLMGRRKECQSPSYTQTLPGGSHSPHPAHSYPIVKGSSTRSPSCKYTMPICRHFARCGPVRRERTRAPVGSIVVCGPLGQRRGLKRGRRLQQLSSASSPPDQSRTPPGKVAATEESTSWSCRVSRPPARRARSAARASRPSVGGQQRGTGGLDLHRIQVDGRADGGWKGLPKGHLLRNIHTRKIQIHISPQEPI